MSSSAQVSEPITRTNLRRRGVRTVLIGPPGSGKGTNVNLITILNIHRQKIFCLFFFAKCVLSNLKK